MRKSRNTGPDNAKLRKFYMVLINNLNAAILIACTI